MMGDMPHTHTYTYTGSPAAAFMDSRDFGRIATAIRYIESNFRTQPRLATIAKAARLSEFHFNRLFRRWAGVTPKQYLAYVTARAARGELSGHASVLEAAYAVGLSGPGRLHDLMVTIEAVTPGELKARGQGLSITYGFTATPFGEALLAVTPRGLSHLAFVEPGAERVALGVLAERWPNAARVHDDSEARALAQRIFAPGTAADGTAHEAPLRLAVGGTNFQVRVWQALIELGRAGPTTYSALARAAGVDDAVRAVGNAVGANPVAWLIPCHNVLRQDGSLGGYAYGPDRKRAMLTWQALHTGSRPYPRQSTAVKGGQPSSSCHVV
jgi:AraC family transcriptional regulator, regulatory protein of adaptative response / methylated-DNA-[protein]-cysteine methyltransferase